MPFDTFDEIRMLRRDNDRLLEENERLRCENGELLCKWIAAQEQSTNRMVRLLMVDPQRMG